MFLKHFYRSLKILSCLFIFITGTAFIYSIKHIPITEALIVGAIFIAGLIVCMYLIKYYGNAIISYKIESDYIELTNAKQNTVKLKRDNCHKIINKPNQLILEFDNSKKYYIHKYYLGYKKFFDFSVFNKNYFTSAVIIDLT